MEKPALTRNSIVLVKGTTTPKKNFFVYPEEETVYKKVKRNPPNKFSTSSKKETSRNTGLRESIQSLPSYLPEISNRVYPHVGRPEQNPYQEVQRSNLMNRYHIFLQQLNIIPVKPPMYELNMRVQRMRAELESKVKRSSRLSSLEPQPKRESVLSNYKQA